MLGWQDTRALTSVLPAKDARKITKAFGYTTCGELLAHYPRDYIRHGHDVGLGGAQEGDIVTLSGTITRHNFRPNGKRSTLTVSVDNRISATFFSASWQRSLLTVGTRVMMSGKLSFYRGAPQLAHPDFMLLDQPQGTKATGSLRNLSNYGELEQLLLGRDWIPIYPATAKVTSWSLMGAIHQVLHTLPHIDEPVEGFDGLSFDEAIRQIHEPDSMGPEMAIERLKYNEALAVGIVMALRRKDASARAAQPLPIVEEGYRHRLLADLPFALTAGQEKVLKEIDADLVQEIPMARLLQGEVGSGKTMVATAAMLQAVDNNKQAALLAPTEVLASQHAQSISAAVPEGVKVVALTGSMNTATKRQALLDIVTGEADIIIGTHAIIQSSVEFFDLGLVVVDEQHRFGVEQREQLRAKAREGFTPHLLVMTATPIPRTIAMTVFGDLAVSTLRELPGGRKPIQSTVVPEFKPEWVMRALARIREEVAAGRQAYVVCPRIEGQGGVLEVHEQLSSGPLAGLRVGLMHGKLPNKDEVMDEFARGHYDVLVSTTVIEVGVDVPNATVMLIRESENFGVSQLHQLRGRVGRGGNASICLFHTLAEYNSPSFTRISAIAETSSGFDLAELDLQQRQEGDVLGTNQSGTHRRLALLNLSRDQEIIERTHRDATELVDRNPEVAARLISHFSDQEQEFLDKN